MAHADDPGTVDFGLQTQISSPSFRHCMPTPRTACLPLQRLIAARSPPHQPERSGHIAPALPLHIRRGRQKIDVRAL